MHSRHVLVIHPRGYGLGHAGVLLAFRVIGGEDADVFHDHLVWFCLEAVDLESSQTQHFVRVLTVFERDDGAEEVVLVFEGTVAGDPVFGVAHV